MIVTLAKGVLYSTLSNTPQQIAEKALAATVSLEMKDKNDVIYSRGSGFFVRHNLIATNYHVIKEAAQGTAKLVGKEMKYTIEGITATDETNDLTLLKVTVQGVNPLPLGNSDTVQIGETVYVVGNPKGLEGTFSSGIISSIRKRHAKKEFQMTAPISPGSSGGPVLNDRGEVIGVSVRTYTGQEAQNLNFAIHSAELKELLEHSGPVRSLPQENRTISVYTYLIQGSKKEKLGDYKGAIVNYTEAIQLKPNDASIYYNRGRAKAKLGQHDAAIADYDTAIRLKPDYVFAYNNRGLAKEELGQHDAAIADYDITIQLKPNDASIYYNRGLAKAKLGQHDAAITDYDTVIRLKSDYVFGYNARGLAKEGLGQHDAAIADYDTAIRLKPDFALTYKDRGRAKRKLGQHEAAIADYDTAIQLKPDFAQAYNNRGLAKAELGQHEAAIADYDTAIRLEPDYALAYVKRGLSQLLLGQNSEAKQDLRTASKLIGATDDQSLKTKIELLLQRIDR